VDECLPVLKTSGRSRPEQVRVAGGPRDRASGSRSRWPGAARAAG